MKITIKENIQFVPSCNLILIDEKEYPINKHASLFLKLLFEKYSSNEFNILTKDEFESSIDLERKKNMGVAISNSVRMVKMLLGCHGIEIITHYKLGYRMKIN